MNSSDDSFQEALTREKTDKGREDILKLTVLNRRGSPHKKVMINNSGWWSLASNDTSNNENDVMNKILYDYRNKNVELYKSIFNPKNKINKIILIDKQDQKYILNKSFKEIINKKIKIYNVNKQTMYIESKGKKTEKNNLHYCREDLGVKEICYKYSNKTCIEIKERKYKYYKEKIELMKKTGIAYMQWIYLKRKACLIILIKLMFFIVYV